MRKEVVKIRLMIFYRFIKIEVYVLHKSSSERLVWDYTLEQGASDYVGESQEIEVNPDLVEIIIKISISC